MVRHEVDLGVLRLLPLTDCELQRQLKLIWNKEWPLSPITYAFLQNLTDQYPAIHAALTVSRSLAGMNHMNGNRKLALERSPHPGDDTHAE